MSEFIELEKQDFKDFKFRLFKKFGRNTGGNPIFINSTIDDLNTFVNSKEFVEIPLIYAYYCFHDKEYIYKLYSLDEKLHFINKKIRESESVNLFDKDLSWVITLFHENMI